MLTSGFAAYPRSMDHRNLSSRARRQLALCLLCLPALGLAHGLPKGQPSARATTRHACFPMPPAPSSLSRPPSQSPGHRQHLRHRSRHPPGPGSRRPHHPRRRRPPRPHRHRRRRRHLPFRCPPARPLPPHHHGRRPTALPLPRDRPPRHRAVPAPQSPSPSAPPAPASRSPPLRSRSPRPRSTSKRSSASSASSPTSTAVTSGAPRPSTPGRSSTSPRTPSSIPSSSLGTAAVAGIQQERNTFPGYGLGAQGYAKRYFADYADEVSNRMFSSAIFPTLFHQDPRYFYKGTGSKTSRALYAISRTFVTRGDNGQQEINYSRLLGGFASGALSNAYHEGQDRGVGLTIRTPPSASGATPPTTSSASSSSSASPKFPTTTSQTLSHPSPALNHKKLAGHPQDDRRAFCVTQLGTNTVMATFP